MTISTIIYTILGWIATVHWKILSWNDTQEIPFTDKQLHFLVIGILGMLMIFVVYPLFKLLANSNHVMVIAWLYVFTLILVISFAIEIGQGYTGSGQMELMDILYGIVGFLLMFAVFSVIRAAFHGVVKLIKRKDNRNSNRKH